MEIEKRKMFFIVNPKAGNWLNRKQRERLVWEIKALFKRAEIAFSEAEGEREIGNLARIAQKEGFKTIIGRGGDGTLNRILNGLDLGDLSLKIGMIPAGTGNDMASALGIPWKTDEALRVIKQETTRQIDIGLVNGLRFANTISVGLDALVNEKATLLKPYFQKLKISPLAYIAAVVLVILGKTEDVEISLNIDKGRKVIEQKIVFAAITNSFRYGRGFLVNPWAEMDDGRLNLCLLEN